METEVIGFRRRSVPQNDVDAERALIALVLCHGAAALDVARDAGVRGGDFVRESLKAIWQAGWRLRSADKMIDAVTVTDELRRAGELEAAGGPATVANIKAEAVHAGAAESYARIVKESAALRRFAEVMRILADDAAAGVAASTDLLADAQRAIVRLAARDGNVEPLNRARAELASQGIGVAEQAPEPIAFACAAELANRTFPPTPWLVRGILTQRALFVVGGEPKTTKTWAALELGMAIATGTKAFGEFGAVGEPAPVALFLAEDSEQATRNRLRALASSRGMSVEKACRRIYHRNLTALDITKDDDLARLVVGVRELPEQPAAIVLDPLRDLHRADENDSTAMSRVMHALRALRSVLGCAVVFVHHAAKASESSKARRPGQRMRGSSVVHGAVDGGLYLTDLKGNLETEWTNTGTVEVKAARGAGSFNLTLTVDDDDAGEAVRASWLHSSAVKTAKRTVAEEVMEALADLEESSPGEFHLVDKIRGLTAKRKEAVIDALHNLWILKRAERSSGRGGYRIALKEMEKRRKEANVAETIVREAAEAPVPNVPTVPSVPGTPGTAVPVPTP